MSKFLFCLKDDTETTFNNVEHILHECIGNTTLILPKGIVCDFLIAVVNIL